MPAHVHAHAVVRVGAGSWRDALRVRALDEQALPRGQRRDLVEQDPDDARLRPFRSRCRGSPARRCTGTFARSAADGVSQWSATGRFNMRWTTGVPQQLPSEPGFVSWTPIEGATGYDVWFGNLGSQTRIGVGVIVGKIVSTITTVADEREYSTLRAPGDAVQWRVRARRAALRHDEERASARLVRPVEPVVLRLPAGPSSETDPVATPLSSDATSCGASAAAVHDLMPAFVFSRDGYKFHRVYVSTDEDCVNVVHVGSIVGGQRVRAANDRSARALSGEVERQERSPRSSSTEPRAKTRSALTARSPGRTRAPPKQDASASSAADHGAGPGRRSTCGTATGPTGRYYWTVVPVTRHPKATRRTPATEPRRTEQQWIYQDACSPRTPARRASCASSEEERRARSWGAARPVRHGSLARRAGFSRPRAGGAPSTACRSGRLDSGARAPRATTSSGAGRGTRGRPPVGTARLRRRRCFRSGRAPGGTGCAESTRRCPVTRR